MRKSILLVGALLIVMGAASVFASGNKEQQPPAASSAQKVQLVYWSHYGQSPPFVQAFADTANYYLPKIGYPNVTMKAVVIPYSNYYEKYLSAFASGTGPDVFVGNPSDWAMKGGLHPVAAPFPADLAKSWEDALAIPFRADGVLDGQRYGFEVEGGSLLLLYYNKDMFQAAGLDPNKPPATLNEFLADAQKLTKYGSDGKIVQSGYAARIDGPMASGTAPKFIPFIQIFGGAWIGPNNKVDGYLNSPQSIAAFQFYHDLVYKYKVISLDQSSPENAFQQGLTAMMFREGWFAADTTQKAPNIHYGVAPFPSGVKNIVATEGGGSWQNMVNNASQHKDIIWALFGAMANPTADVMLHKPAGYPPVLAATMTMSNPYFSSLPYAQATIDSLNKEAAPVYPQTPINTQLRTVLGQMVVADLNGTPVNQVVDNGVQQMNQIVAKWKAQQ
jgi:ABC-type glycerol-3-phosphate transport system substrate-binding protein